MRRYGPAMPIGPRQPAAAKPVWESGARVRFHYTQPDFAELILAEQTYRVSAQEGRAGHGLYVTSAQPGSMSDEALLRLLFTRPRPALFVEGVVILRDDAFRGCGTRRASTSIGPSRQRPWTCRWCSLGSVPVAGGLGYGRRASTSDWRAVLS